MALAVGLFLWSLALSREAQCDVYINVEKLDAVDAANLARLLNEFTAGDPFASPEVVRVLATHVHATRRASRWVELKRTGDSQSVAVLNTCLDRLQERFGDAGLAELQTLDENQLSERIGDALHSEPAQENAKIDELLAQPEYQSLVGRITRGDLPKAPSLVRRLALRVWNKPDDDQHRWRMAFLKTLREEKSKIVELNDWYQRVSKVREIELAKSGPFCLELSRLNYQDNRLPNIHWEAERTTMDWELCVRREADRNQNGPDQVTRTGLYVQEKRIARKVGDSPGIIWPPQLVSADSAKLQKWLFENRFPNALHLDSVQVSAIGDESQPTVLVAIRIGSQDFPDWKWNGELSVSIARAPSLSQTIETLGSRALASLRDHVTKAQSLQRVPAHFIPLPELPSSWRVRVEPRRGPSINLAVSLTDAGRLVWLGPASAADHAAIVDWLGRSQADLKKAGADLVVTNVSLDTAGQLSGSLLVRSEKADLPPIVWSTGEDGIPQKLPEPVKRMLDEKPIPAAVAAENPAGTLESIKARLQKLYPKEFASIIQFVKLQSGEVQLALQIEHLPLLILGSITPVDQETDRQIKSLLNRKNVIRTSQQQWRRNSGQPGWSHPKYGLVGAQIKDWEPEQPVVSVQFDAPLWTNQAESANKDAIPQTSPLNLAWVEKLTSGSLGGHLEAAAINTIEGQLDGLLNTINEVAKRTFDGLLRFEPDNGDIPNGHWVSLSPPAVTLRARIKLPGEFKAVGTNGILHFDVRGVRLDRDGIHFPQSIRATWRTTFWAAYFAISDPSIFAEMDSQQRLSIGIGCKITPPMPPALAAASGINPDATKELAKQLHLPTTLANVRWDNPWLHVIALDAEMSFRWKDPRVRVEGRLQVAQSCDVATGTLDWLVKENRLMGQLRATANKICDVPLCIEGTFVLDATGLRSKGQFDVIGIATAQSSLVLDFNRMKLGIIGNMDFRWREIGTNMNVKGFSDLDFQRYALRGEASINGGWLIGKDLWVVLQVRPEGWSLDYSWKVRGKQVSREFRSGRDGRFDFDEIEKQIRVANDEAEAVSLKSPTTAELQYLETLNRPVDVPSSGSVPTEQQMGMKPQPPVPMPPLGNTRADNGGKYVLDTVGNVYCFDQRNDKSIIQFCYTVSPDDFDNELYTAANLKDALFAPKSLLGIPDHTVSGNRERLKNGQFKFKQPSDFLDAYTYILFPVVDRQSRKVERSSLCLINHNSKELCFLRCDDIEPRLTLGGNENFKLIDFTTKFADVPIQFGTQKQRSASRKWRFYEGLIELYADALHYHSKPLALHKRGEDCYSFEVKVSEPHLEWGPRGDHELYVCLNENDPTDWSVVSIMSSVQKSERTDAFFDCLRKSRITSVKVVAALHAEHVVTTIQAKDVDSCQAAYLTKDTPPKLKYTGNMIGGVDIRVLNSASGLSDEQMIDLSARIAKLLWKLPDHDRQEATAVYIGALGMIVEFPRRYLLLPDKKKFDSKCPEGGCFLDRNRFIQWQTESKELLGRDWKSKENRLGQTSDKFAEVALQDWDALRDAPDEQEREAARSWRAHPFGLLLGLIEEIKQ